MRVPIDPSPRTRRLGVGGMTVIALVLAACSSTPAGAAGPTTPAGTPPSQGPASAAVTPAPTATTSATASPATGLVKLALLWQQSGPPQSKPSTYWPAINPVTGDIWVASSFDDAFWIFKPDGTYVESWGSTGSGNGQFVLHDHAFNPDGTGPIAFAPDGSFFVGDSGNDRVQAFDAKRHFVRAWGSFGTGDSQFASLRGLATDGKTVYVSDDARADIQAFTADGAFLRAFPFPFVLFSLAGGHLFTAGGDFSSGFGGSGVLETDPKGATVAEFPIDPADIAGGGISQVVVDKAGDIFATIQDRTSGDPFVMIELDPQGVVLGKWAGGGETAAITPDGTAIYDAYTAPQGSWDFIRKFAIPTP